MSAPAAGRGPRGRAGEGVGKPPKRATAKQERAAPPRRKAPCLVVRTDPKLARAARGLARRIGVSREPRELRAEAAAMVLKLTESGLAGFFLHPVEAMDLGFVAASSVRLGLQSARSGIAFVANRVINGMDDDQVRALGKHIEGFLLDLGAE